MIRTFRYPLYLTKAQEAILESWLAACCALYNAALEHRCGAWTYEKRQRQAAFDRGTDRRPGKTPTRYDQQKELTALRAADDALGAIPSRVLRSAVNRVDASMDGFFRRCASGEKPGFPRFRSPGRYHSFDFGSSVRRVDVDGKRGRFRVPRLGIVRFKAYRPLKGTVRDISIKRTSHNWEAAIACDLGEAPLKRPVCDLVGVDLGLTSFVALSNGEKIEAPRYYRKAEDRVAAHQRVLSRKKKGSNGQRKQRRVVARAHERIRNQRLDFCRKLAAVLFARFDLVAYEDLNIRAMVHGTLAKSIYDAGWAVFIRCLQAKAEEAGLWAVPVDPRGTSQRCSRCGAHVPKDISVRVHACERCGYTADRDVNAAKNVEALGRSAVSLATAMSPKNETFATHWIRTTAQGNA